MPSTVVHVALAGLVGTALLAEYFDWKAVAVVMAATAFIDLDAVLGLWIRGAHRAAFHTLLLPLLAGVLLWWDVRVRDRSLVRSRWGARGVRVAWVSVVAVLFAGIGLDAFFNGVNLFYPIHDQFYDLSGKVYYSTKDGFVQTIFHPNLSFLTDWATHAGTAGAKTGGSGAASGGGSGHVVHTTKNTHYSTAVDPTAGATKKPVERLAPIAYNGERALLALTGYTVVGLRIWLDRDRERGEIASE